MDQPLSTHILYILSQSSHKPRQGYCILTRTSEGACILFTNSIKSWDPHNHGMMTASGEQLYETQHTDKIPKRSKLVDGCEPRGCC